MATVTKDIISFNSGQQIAQLLLLPLLPSEHKHINPTRGCGGSVSSDVYWVTQIALEKPLLNIQINGTRLLIDTGTDVTVIKGSELPSSWPLTLTITHLKGIGQSQNPHKNALLLYGGILREIRDPFNHMCWMDCPLIFGEEIFYLSWVLL